MRLRPSVPLGARWTIVMRVGGASAPLELTRLYFWTRRSAEKWAAEYARYPGPFRYEAWRIRDLPDPPPRRRLQSLAVSLAAFALTVGLVYGTEFVTGREMPLLQVAALGLLMGTLVSAVAKKLTR